MSYVVLYPSPEKKEQTAELPVARTGDRYVILCGLCNSCFAEYRLLTDGLPYCHQRVYRSSMDGMSFKDKTLCKMVRKSLEKKDPKDYAVWEAALVEAVDTGKDWTDKEYIKPIIEECGK